VTGRKKTYRTAYVLIILSMLHFSISCESGKANYRNPLIIDGRAIVDVSSLKDMVPVFYSVDIDSTKVDFFVVSIKGTIEAYLDACENCYHHRKGYLVEGYHIICRYCGSRYLLDSLKVGIASCHPMPLKGEVENETYVISLKEIEKARRFF